MQVREQHMQQCVQGGGTLEARALEQVSTTASLCPPHSNRVKTHQKNVGFTFFLTRALEQVFLFFFITLKPRVE